MPAFQFHKGTIRTKCLRIPESRRSNFNSIKVQLEHGEKINKEEGKLYFNSIKVQLERASSLTAEPVANNFNSIKVQLEHQNQLMQDYMDQQFQFHTGTIRTS